MNETPNYGLPLLTSADDTKQVLSTFTELMGENPDSAMIKIDAAIKAVENSLDEKSDAADVLTKTNTAEYTPTADYHPATRKFVLDNSGGDYLPLTGGTIIGPLEVKDSLTLNGITPQAILSSPSSDVEGSLGVHAEIMRIEAKNTHNMTEMSLLFRTNVPTSDSLAVELDYTPYLLFGEHNFPNMSQVTGLLDAIGDIESLLAAI